MNSSTWFMFAALAIVVVQSRRLDPGPQTFTERTPAIQKPQKRYAMKEVVVYLTPSQITAIQEGRGFISAQPIEPSETSEENQEETEQAQQELGDDDQLRPVESDSQILEEEDDQVPSSIPVEEPNTEEIEEEPQEVNRPSQDSTFVPSPEDLFAYLRLYPETETQTEEAQAESEESEEESEESEEIETEAPRQQRFKLVPYEDATEKSEPTTTEAPQEEPLRERWLRLLEQNRSQLRKSLPAQEKTTTEQTQAEPESTLARFRFSARYNDQKQAIENEKKLKKNQSEKQKGRKAVTRANNPSVLVRKAVSVEKQRPQIKRVKVSTPALVPIPEQFGVKERPISSKAAKAKKAQAKKSVGPARAEGEKIASSPKKLSAPVEKTYVIERRVPVDTQNEGSVDGTSRRPERITIIRQIWEN